MGFAERGEPGACVEPKRAHRTVATRDAEELRRCGRRRPRDPHPRLFGADARPVGRAARKLRDDRLCAIAEAELVVIDRAGEPRDDPVERRLSGDGERVRARLELRRRLDRVVERRGRAFHRRKLSADLPIAPELNVGNFRIAADYRRRSRVRIRVVDAASERRPAREPRRPRLVEDGLRRGRRRLRRRFELGLRRGARARRGRGKRRSSVDRGALGAGGDERERRARAPHLTSSSSMSKTSVARGGIFGGLPVSP